MQTTTRPDSRLTIGHAGAIIGVLLLLVAAGCGGSGGSSGTSTRSSDPARLTVTGAWARPGSARENTAIYLTIHGAGTADSLVGVDLPTGLADSVGIHETTKDSHAPMSEQNRMHGGEGSGMPPTTMAGGGMLTMRPVDSIPVPAGGQVALAPGGYHVMVMGLRRNLVPGDTFRITVRFAHAGAVGVPVTVRKP
ncbi:MAG: copper chaperone PCu(A)C [Actinobacteria bacterium]|nr:copper chaperone PCu(A)C [Actinomycetota bacterium]